MVFEGWLKLFVSDESVGWTQGVKRKHAGAEACEHILAGLRIGMENKAAQID